MKVLVTGSSGFLGRHILRSLTGGGIPYVEFDSHLGHDVRNTEDFSVAEGCTHVIHLAGVLGTAELFDAPHEAVDVNIHGTLNVLKACERYDLSYVGITMPDVWDNVYQATKICSMRLANAWRRHQGVPVCHVRAFNAYGVGQKLGPVQKIIPTFAHRAWRNEPLPVWGTGEQQADLVWAGDIADVFVQALQFGSGEVFDAGTGHGMSVNEIAEWVIAYTGSKSVIDYRPMRPGEHDAKVVADGEGWELLDVHPLREWKKLSETVTSYR